jgi:hypothetical protein
MVMAWSKPSILTLDGTALNVPELKTPLYIVLSISGPAAGETAQGKLNSQPDGMFRITSTPSWLHIAANQPTLPCVSGDQVYVSVPQEAWDASKSMSFHAKLIGVDWNVTEPVDLGFSKKTSIQLPECEDCPLINSDVVFWNGEKETTYNISKFDLW